MLKKITVLALGTVLLSFQASAMNDQELNFWRKGTVSQYKAASTQIATYGTLNSDLGTQVTALGAGGAGVVNASIRDAYNAPIKLDQKIKETSSKL
ncbi:MAG TPA: hypothetical protein VI959_01480 [Alphaproteobacteria bacterium]|nr:hypothetical protein [Alphaproteobacteria bacterium]